VLIAHNFPFLKRVAYIDFKRECVHVLVPPDISRDLDVLIKFGDACMEMISLLIGVLHQRSQHRNDLD
jgi:hypothetical protein